MERTQWYWVLYSYLHFWHLDKASTAMIPHAEVAKRNVFFFLSADYGNLGDYAISYAQRRFLQQVFPDSNLVELKMGQTGLANVYSKCAHCDDVVAIVGGGNMGNLYYQYELDRQYVIDKFSCQRVVSFPQSLYLTDDYKGKIIGNLMTQFYTKHKTQIRLLFREEQSYNRAQSVFPGNTKALVPDIVLTLDAIKTSQRSPRALICIRNDRESMLQMGALNGLLEQIQQHDFTCESVDTHMGDGVFEEQYLHTHFEKLLDRFRSSSFVITDRLHGMIFSYITGTPAIVLPNNNGKIESSYHWIEDCGYITFCNDIAALDFSQWAEELKTKKVDYDQFNKRRDFFLKLIKDACDFNYNTRL